MNKAQAIENSALINKTLELWLSIKQRFLKAFGGDRIEENDEQEFRRINGIVLRNVKTLDQNLEILRFKSGPIESLMQKCVSLDQLREMPVSDRRALYRDWHTTLILLTQAQGALEFIQDGWKPYGSSGDQANAKHSAKGFGKQRKYKDIVILLIFCLAALAGAAYYFFFSRSKTRS